MPLYISLVFTANFLEEFFFARNLDAYSLAFLTYGNMFQHIHMTLCHHYFYGQKY